MDEITHQLSFALFFSGPMNFLPIDLPFQYLDLPSITISLPGYYMKTIHFSCPVILTTSETLEPPSHHTLNAAFDGPLLLPHHLYNS